MAISRFAGIFNALDYAYGVRGGGAALQVLNGSTTAGTYTLTCSPTSLYTSAGLAIPISAVCPIQIGGDSQQEIITASAVSTNNLNQLLITGTFTYAHGTGAQVSSGTYGLQEAILAASKYGGAQVAVDAAWFQAGGTQAILNAATQYAGVQVVDNSGTSGGTVPEAITVTLTNAQVKGMFATPVELLPTPDANSLYLITLATLVNLNGGTAWTGGGAIEIGYGAAVTTNALASTVASTFLTSPTVTQIIAVAGATIGTSTESTFGGQPIYINNATAAFATGTGTLQVTLQYVKIYT
jgi:hypothetical protein